MKLALILVSIFAVLAGSAAGGLFIHNRSLARENTVLLNTYSANAQNAQEAKTTNADSESGFLAYLGVLDAIKQGYLSVRTPFADFAAIDAAIAITGDAELSILWDAAKKEQQGMRDGSWNPVTIGNIMSYVLRQLNIDSEELQTQSQSAAQPAFDGTADNSLTPREPQALAQPTMPRLSPADDPTTTIIYQETSEIVKTPIAQPLPVLAPRVRTNQEVIDYLCDSDQPTCPRSALMPELGALRPRTVQISTNGKYFKCVNFNTTFYDWNGTYMHGDCPEYQSQVPQPDPTPFCVEIVDSLSWGAPISCEQSSG